MSKETRLLSVKELATELGVSVDSVRRAYWKGQIPAFRICRMLRFDLERVRQLLSAKGLPGALRASAVRVGDSRPHGGTQRPRRGNTGARIAAPER